MATSSSFSGTMAVSSGSLADFIDRCQVFLNDEGDATWDTEMIGTFLNDALRDYSQHFPRVKQQTINMSAGEQNYELAADLLGVISVEYPAGEQPPRFLARKPFSLPRFWDSIEYYDVIHKKDDGANDELWITAEPSAGQTAVITYNATHQLMADPSTPTESLSVPEEHQPLLVKYVLWQAALHLASAEQQSPTSNSSLLMSQLHQNARRAELAYHTALRQATYAAEGQSAPVLWAVRGTAVERIY